MLKLSELVKSDRSDVHCQTGLIVSYLLHDLTEADTLFIPVYALSETGK